MLKSLVQEGWGYHDTDSERLALELESAPLDDTQTTVLAECLRLSNHTIGEHLNDWPRALRLVDKAIAANRTHEPDSATWMQLAIAGYMNAELSLATAAEINCLQTSKDAMTAYVTLKSYLASSLVGSGRIDEAAAVLKALNVFASESGASMPFDRAIAIANNNIANELLEAPDPDPEVTKLMLECANTTLVFWKRCGTWINEERALYLLASVHNTAKQHQTALDYALKALEVIHANGVERGR